MAYTAEELAQHISAAFDSVNLINQLDELTPPLSDGDAATRLRNVDHLKVMMAIQEFTDGLTTQQATDINALII